MRCKRWWTGRQSPVLYMNICSQQELPEQCISSLEYVHVQNRQQLGRLTAPMHYNPCIYEDMWGEWECILVTFHANVILSAETWIHNWINSHVFFWQRKSNTASTAGLEQPHLTSCVLWQLLSKCRLCCHLFWISLGCYDAAQLNENITSVLEWRCPARAFLRAMSFLASLHNSGTQSICTSMKSFHAIRKETKSKGPLATFFFLTASQRRAGTMEALGCCSPRLRRTAETHSIIMRACRLWPNLLRMIHIVSITDPAASR